MKIAPQGYSYIAILFGIGILVSFFPPVRLLAPPFLLLGLFVGFFFRDPERIPPHDPNLLVAPADGRVVYVGPEQDLETGRTQVSIFLSLFNVHINRSPITAVIDGVNYTRGRFLPAYRSEASFQNEQNEIQLNDGSMKVTVRQIAGVVARRIVFYRQVNDRVEKGERLGLIQFGSRVDVFLPPEVRVALSVGDRVKGGESILGEIV